VPSYFLTTARLGFRRWSAADSRLALLLWGDIKVTRFIGGPFSRGQIRARLTREIASMGEYGIQYWPVFLLTDGAFAGCCGLRPYKPEEGVCELGFHFRPKYWGQGLAVEAARAMIRHASESLKARALFAGHYPDNRASARVLEKLGFVFTHEEIYAPTGRIDRCHILRLSG
jgi:[ribosomal protein S5]-alanine N-acetyltransferase